MCRDGNCKNSEHRAAISAMYEDIVKVLLESGESLQKVKAKKKGKPGWNAHVAEFFTKARQASQEWILAGKPRHGPVYEQKRVTNAQYKYAIRFITKNERAMRADSMARKLSCNNTSDFRKEVKTVTARKTSLPCAIDGTSGTDNILELWRQHYSRLFNCVQSEICMVNDVDHVDVIMAHEVLKAVTKLSKNKASGQDGVSAEHLKFASVRLAPMLSLCFTAFLVHGFLPDSMLTVLLVPVIKNKTGKVGNSDNYRPIALASIVSKVIKMILLDRISQCIRSADNQFGFKAMLGTDMCIYALKEIIQKYKRQNSTVFVFFRCIQSI